MFAGTTIESKLKLPSVTTNWDPLTVLSAGMTVWSVSIVQTRRLSGPGVVSTVPSVIWNGPRLPSPPICPNVANPFAQSPD
jgi:hypothetical protein